VQFTIQDLLLDCAFHHTTQLSPLPDAQYLYLPSATVLKRWAGDTASRLFVHVDESLQGMDVIRAFGAVNYFIQVCLHTDT